VFRVVIIFIFCILKSVAQDSLAIRDILSFQDNLNKEFASKDTSPLLHEDLEEFRTLSFYTIDTSYRIRAKFLRTPYESTFVMKTTSGSEPVYVKYGELSFVLEDVNYVLNIYQNQVLVTNPEYADYLFLPFTDLTNGDTTYAGGRFIDLKIPEGNTILIDFNKAYNPYCAYNTRYSCPIPPEENHLATKIRAGVKRFKQYPENK